jgi:hypothetical protein
MYLSKTKCPFQCERIIWPVKYIINITTDTRQNSALPYIHSNFWSSHIEHVLLSNKYEIPEIMPLVDAVGNVVNKTEKYQSEYLSNLVTI